MLLPGKWQIKVNNKLTNNHKGDINEKPVRIYTRSPRQI